MILILSEENDVSTNKIMEWLSYKKKDFVRYNFESFIKELKIDIGNSGIEVALDNFKLEKITSVLIRRKEFRFSFEKIDLEYLRNWGKYEIEGLKFFIRDFIRSKNNLGGFSSEKHNKLGDLMIAQEVGLKIPDTLVATNKNDIITFLENHERCIYKPITSPFVFSDDNSNYIINGTKRITISDVEKLQNRFFPFLVQEEINKFHEIRTLFFENLFFSMAIFSVEHPQMIDYRLQYDKGKIRNVPFTLPESVKSKIRSFYEIKEVNMGIIDMIYTSDNEYVFLENNNNGQFDMISNRCNYSLEKLIAESL